MLKKAPMKFDKELFKGTVLNNIKTLYRRTLEEATEQQIFQAVSYAIKDVVVDNWMATQKEYEKKDPKIVYFILLSAVRPPCSGWLHSRESTPHIRHRRPPESARGFPPGHRKYAPLPMSR